MTSNPYPPLLSQNVCIENLYIRKLYKTQEFSPSRHTIWNWHLDILIPLPSWSILIPLHGPVSSRCACRWPDDQIKLRVCYTFFLFRALIRKSKLWNYLSSMRIIRLRITNLCESLTLKLHTILFFVLNTWHKIKKTCHFERGCYFRTGAIAREAQAFR